MLYSLIYSLHEWFSPLNVFRYITFRTSLAIITAMVFSLILGPWIIGKLRRLSLTQQIRDDGPKAHIGKAGTPTMGGLLIILCILISWSTITTKIGSFHFFLLFLESSVMGLFMATDLLLFYLYPERT